MKCGYPNCKHGGEVAKEEGIKVGTRWFHKECQHEKEVKQEIEKYWLENINRGSVIQVLRKAINDLSKNNDVDYVFWVVKNCKTRGIKLSHPMGMKALCSDNRFYDEWNKKISVQKAKEMESEFQNYVNEKEIDFKYKINTRNFKRII